MFSFFKRKPKEKWALVKTLTYFVYQTSNPSIREPVYFHLFESSIDNRKVEIVTKGLTGYSMESVIKTAKTSELYQKQIYRWEMGRLDPQIPRYSQIAEEDTANMLRGKIE